MFLLFSIVLRVRNKGDDDDDDDDDDPVVYICHRDSHLIVPYRCIICPAVSWPSPRSSSFWLDHECFTLGSRWCHPILMCDHHLILFLLAVCSAGCMFTRCLISSFLTLSILVFPAAFPRHLISVVVNTCLSLLARVQFSLW